MPNLDDEVMREYQLQAIPVYGLVRGMRKARRGGPCIWRDLYRSSRSDLLITYSIYQTLALTMAVKLAIVVPLGCLIKLAEWSQ